MRSNSPARPEHASVLANHARYVAGGSNRSCTLGAAGSAAHPSRTPSASQRHCRSHCMNGTVPQAGPPSHDARHTRRRSALESRYKPHADNHLVPRRRYRRPQPGGMTPSEASVDSTAVNRWLLALHRPDDPRPDGCRGPDPDNAARCRAAQLPPAAYSRSSAIDAAAARGVSCRLLVLPADLRARINVQAPSGAAPDLPHRRRTPL